MSLPVAAAIPPGFAGADSVQGAGTATAPAAGSAFAVCAAASLPAGVYRVTYLWMISGAADTTVNNIQIKGNGGAGGVTLAQPPGGTSQNVMIQGELPRVTMDGASPIRLQPANNAAVGCVYTGSVQATRIA